MPIAWTSDLETGIEEIDNQHKRIVDYINKLEGAIEQHDRFGVGQILKELTDYTISHFAFEESLQEEAGYEMAKPHKAVHDLFARRVSGYKERHHAGQDIAPQLHSMLSTWLLHHIKRDDMAYVNDVRGNMGRLSEEEQGESWLSRSIGKFFKPEA